MFIGSTNGGQEFVSQTDILDPDNAPEVDDDEEEDAECSSHIIHMATFDELAGNYIQYDTIIWLSISLLLVLAWGVGVILLLYLPVFRYVLQKDLSSRKLYVTPTEIVYKARRPSFIPCWKTVTIETRVPLSLVIDIIIEQGCLQSVFGLHTFRVQSISCGKAAPVDELQVQGMSNPGLLRKVIITEAVKVAQEGGSAMTHPSSFTDRLHHLQLASKKWKSGKSAFPLSSEQRGMASADLLFHKVDEVHKSVKNIESLIDKSKFPSAIN